MASCCETCEYYDYDEEYEENICKIDMDEDEYLRFHLDKAKKCPYYQYNDEYISVRKQI